LKGEGGVGVCLAEFKMIGFLLRKVFGTKYERDIRKLRPLVQAIKDWEPALSKLSDEQLRAKTAEFKERLTKGETLDDLLPEAFAVVRETCKRLLGKKFTVCKSEWEWIMVPFDVQLIGGIVLHQGKIAEMATGEGKTLVATMPAYLNALSGKGVHIVTVNDYLARRDREWMGPIYEFLGLTVGVIQHDMSPQEKKIAYNCDLAYGTNNEFGFDYLRDNMAIRREDRVQREFYYAIVDEVDSILIDEARTPLIISGPVQESTQIYYKIDRVVRQLKVKVPTKKESLEETKAKQDGRGGIDEFYKGYDAIFDEKAHTFTLLKPGGIKCERLLGIDLSDPANIDYQGYINASGRAYKGFRRDVDYVVKDGRVIIVDEFTGRLMPGRRWSDGLHQAIEAKENLKIEEENQTLATVTLQNYFRLYEKLAGMTGTAETEAGEFKKIYNLEVVVIPTNKPLVRYNYSDVIYKTEKEKFKAVIEEVIKLNKEERPVLVGTRSIETSERLGEMLKRRGVKHNVLNAKHHEMEAQIIAQSGQGGAVTIATNMAGRGTDIVLGEGVAKRGGLHITGTERHEARRIDNQLRGRTGRQGDPGSSRFYLSLEDELMRLFGSERIARVMDTLGIEEDQPIEHPWISKAIETAQKRVESHHFEIRKHLLEFDDVMNEQREVIYKQRREVLEGKDLKEEVMGMIEDGIENLLPTYTNEKTLPEEWDLKGLAERIRYLFPITLDKIDPEEINQPKLREMIVKKVKEAYLAREEELSSQMMRKLEQMVTLQVVDIHWKDHLYAMDHLREGIHLRSYAGKNPVVEYKIESYQLFDSMTERIREEIVEYIFKLRVVGEERERRRIPVKEELLAPVLASDYGRPELPLPAVPPEEAEGAEVPPEEKPVPVRVERKIGRNEPCPCGSGKKYKKCCGK
jgi:preprotein translocase subunit SecA